MVRTTFRVKQVSDNVDVDEVSNGTYDEPGIQFDKVPEFTLTVPALSGISNHILANGKEVQIRRGGNLEFPGIVDTPSGEESGSTHGLTVVKGVHKGYHLMQALECTNYDFDEDGLTRTSLDGVTINPWYTTVFRNPFGDVDPDTGVVPGVDGVRIDEMVKMLCGTKFVHQSDFWDNSWFLPSGVYNTASNTVQVYMDGESTTQTPDVRPYLQRIRSGTSTNFAAGGALESVPLYSGDRNVREMGQITSATVLIIGRIANLDHPTIQLCRDAVLADGSNNPSRTYQSVTLTSSGNYINSGLEAWTGTVTFSGAQDVTNALGYRITVPGTAGTSSTTKVAYLKIVASVLSDTGVEEGSIQQYQNPFPILGEENWIETDLQGKTRLEAMEEVRKSTVSGRAEGTSAHWDAWIDETLHLHFKESRGTVVPKVYSFANENVRKLGHEFYGKELAYQTIAYGTGSGLAQNRIVSKEQWYQGGLYDFDRDPSNPLAIYGNLPRVMSFVDQNETSAVSLLRKAQAFHKVHRDPVESIRLEILNEHIAYFGVGDYITIRNVRTRTNRPLRVVELSRAWSGSARESIRIRLGEPEKTFIDSIHRGETVERTMTLHHQPAGTATGLAGNGVYFSKDDYGVYTFGIEDGAAVNRVSVTITTVPWTSPISGTTFGLNVFKGDTPGSTPVYAVGLQFAVDPTLNASGLPSTFSTQRHPSTFGVGASPITQTFDITGYIDRDSNGVATSGVHRIFFLGTAGSNNTNGLGVASVTPIITFNTG